MLRALECEPELDPRPDSEPDRPAPTRDDTGGAAIEWARSGAMALTGLPDQPPEFANGALASAAKGALVALEAISPGRGFATMDGPALLGERSAIDGLSRRGQVSAGGSAQLLATFHGGLVLNLPRDEDWQMIPAWLGSGRHELAKNRDWKSLARLVADRDSTELIERGRIMGLAVADIARPTESPPQRPPQSAQAKTDPPAPTSPNNHPLLHLRHETETEKSSPRRQKKRLLDLSNLWAGPLASSLLAVAGIEVLKIESPTRPDGARRGAKHFFDLMNGNKRGCALDLRAQDDCAIFARLLDSADIVVESARPRALQQLGFDACAWVAGRPGRIWASITGYGRAREWIAFGDDAAVAAGLAWAPDATSVEPRFCGDAIADPLGGLHAAVAILGLLEKGRGGLLDLSLVDIAAYAATIEHDGLLLDVERARERWCVIENGRRVLIEAPRARPAAREAPKLRAPDAALISVWTQPC